ncbi:hypothetical protein [Nitrosomonas mobilis]|uniref:hypothetical protein n=1 Tax=Nitrosomonas mobilis TaxID=51642 RepID=UPI00115FE99D|nr:hypothetical protein [Nitrosomonas mobilis]
MSTILLHGYAGVFVSQVGMLLPGTIFFNPREIPVPDKDRFSGITEWRLLWVSCSIWQHFTGGLNRHQIVSFLLVGTKLST